jgi:O-antigen/teichoic acid export membrane protein
MAGFCIGVWQLPGILKFCQMNTLVMHRRWKRDWYDCCSSCCGFASCFGTLKAVACPTVLSAPPEKRWVQPFTCRTRSETLMPPVQNADASSVACAVVHSEQATGSQKIERTSTTVASDFKTLYQQSSHYLAGRVVVMVLGLLSFPVFTRLFSVEEYGLLNLVVKTVAVFVVVAKMGVQNSVMRFYQDFAIQGDRRTLRSYYSTLYFGIFVFAALATILFDVFIWFAPTRFFSPLLRQLLLLGSGLIFIRGVFSVLVGFWRVQERTILFNAVDALNKVAVIAVICLLAFTWERSVRAFLGGSLIVEGASVLIASYMLFHQGLIGPGACNSRFFKDAITYGAPLIFYELFGVVLASADRFLVQYYLGSRELGYYSAAYNLSSSLQESVVAPLALALFPIYMRLWATKGREATQTFLSGIFNHFALVSIGIIALVCLVSKDAIVLLASAKFQNAYTLVPLLVAALLLAASHFFIDPGLLIYRKTGIMARIAVYSTGVNIALNVLLLPRLGLYGAGLATLLSYLFMTLLTLHSSFALLPIPLQLERMAKFAMAAAIVFFAFRGLHIKSPLVGLAVKGTLCTAGYLALVLLLDKTFRLFVTSHLVSRLYPSLAETN